MRLCVKSKDGELFGNPMKHRGPRLAFIKKGKKKQKMLLIITEVFLYFEQSSARLQLRCTIPVMSAARACQVDRHWLPCMAPVRHNLHSRTTKSLYDIEKV